MIQIRIYYMGIVFGLVPEGKTLRGKLRYETLGKASNEIEQVLLDAGIPDVQIVYKDWTNKIIVAEASLALHAVDMLKTKYGDKVHTEVLKRS